MTQHVQQVNAVHVDLNINPIEFILTTITFHCSPAELTSHRAQIMVLTPYQETEICMGLSKETNQIEIPLC